MNRKEAAGGVWLDTTRGAGRAQQSLMEKPKPQKKLITIIIIIGQSLMTKEANSSGILLTGNSIIDHENIYKIYKYAPSLLSIL